MQLAALKHPIICVTPSPRTLIRLRSRSFRSKKPSRVSDTRTICADRQEYSAIILSLSLTLSSDVLLLEFYFPAVRFPIDRTKAKPYLRPAVKVSESISAAEYSMCSSTCFWLVERVPSVPIQSIHANNTRSGRILFHLARSRHGTFGIEWQLPGVGTSWNFKGKYRKRLPPGRACAACSCSAKCQRLFKVSRGGTVQRVPLILAHKGAPELVCSSWLEY